MLPITHIFCSLIDIFKINACTTRCLNVLNHRATPSCIYKLCTFSSILSILNLLLIASFLPLSCLLAWLGWSLNNLFFFLITIRSIVFSFFSLPFDIGVTPWPVHFPLSQTYNSLRYILHSSSNQELHGKLDLICPMTRLWKYWYPTSRMTSFKCFQFS